MILFPVVVALILYFTGLPIAFALITASLSYFTFANTGAPVDLVLQKFISSTSSFPLLAVPFFIMAGEIMNYSGISAKMMEFADVLTGHMRGGLAQTNIVLSTLMGGVSGSANADAAMEAKILVPEMEKRGYGKAFSTAVTAASSAIAPVIPPGINLIIYALIASVSVGKMFIAGYIPGFLMCAALMITVSLISKKRGYTAMRDKMTSPKEVIKQLIDSIWALFMPFGIILGMRYGLFTPTEAGAIAVLYCTIIGFFVYRKLELKHFPIIIRDTLYSTASVVLIIVAANVFSYYMTWERIPQQITKFLMNFSENKYLMLMLINLMLLILGMFLEGGAALIITAPLLVPVVVGMGIDPIHFGMIMIVNIMIGGVTPPFGSMMFTTCSITKAPITDFVKEVFPFIIALLVVLVLVTYLPQIILFIPNLMF